MGLDYSALGLRVGLEIHVQLATKCKLFCHCPPVLRDDEPHFRFERRLRVAVSELGEVDPAAVWEVRKRRTFVYEGYLDSTCLVELDEEPPHMPDEEALETALAVAKAFNARVLDEIYVMRKVVVDGSNVSGFQRTMLVAVDGEFRALGYRVGVQSIALEEDAARKVGEGDGRVVYRLDRLGIPLIEVSTAPMSLEPWQVGEVAWLIGYSVKATGRARRGIGSVRQDVNVSISGGAKTEIKGVGDLSILPKVIEYEVMRQLRLLAIRDELARRGVSPEDVGGAVDVTDIFANTKSRLIRGVLERGGIVVAVKAPGFAGLLGAEVQPGRRFGSELADYVRAWTGLGGLLHSDELPGYGISADEKRAVEQRLGVGSFVLLAGPPEEVWDAVEIVVARLRQAFAGVPEETRAAMPDGTTRFMRPRPGAARMYPETDLPPIRPGPELLARASELAAKANIDARVSQLVSMGLSRELAVQLVKSPWLDAFDELVRSTGAPPTLVASTLLNTLRQLEREGVRVELPVVEGVLRLYAAGRIAKEAIPELLRAAPSGGDLEAVARERGLLRLGFDEVMAIVRDAVARVGPDRGKVMREVMSKYRGRVEASDVAKALDIVLSGSG